jgi:hypothetical protein
MIKVWCWVAAALVLLWGPAACSGTTNSTINTPTPVVAGPTLLVFYTDN